MAVAVLTAVPVRAQTYDPNSPVCLQVYTRGGGYIECGYTSLAQCAAMASGRSAQCLVNPYYSGPQLPAGARHPKHGRAY